MESVQPGPPCKQEMAVPDDAEVSARVVEDCKTQITEKVTKSSSVNAHRLVVKYFSMVMA